MNWIIIDLMGNQMDFGQFKSFEDGWEHLYLRFPSMTIEDLDEYYVIQEEAVR